MKTSETHEPPQVTKFDAAHALARAGISAIPVIGSPAVELLGLLITPPLEKRRQKWMADVGEALRKLEESGKLKLEDLRDNEAFIDTVLQATQIALRTSQEEKREALRNAVLNSALKPLDDYWQQTFLNLVDDLTGWHLRLLSLLDNPLAWFKSRGLTPRQFHISSSISQLICDAFPELANQRALYDQVGKELHARGLTRSDSLHVMMSADGAYQEHSTDLGRRFLKFISAPSA